MRPEPSVPERVNAVAGLALLAGAAGSVAVTLYVGRHNPSRVLILLFAAWVLSPFLGLALADARLGRGAAPLPAALRGLMWIVSLGSLAVYGHAVLRPPASRTAFVFLVAPLASWVLVTVVLAASALVSRRQTRPGPPA